MAAEAIRAGHNIGPYELLSPIGAGGMGEVWKARDTRLDRVVAIKFSHAQFTERFEREARAIAALNHPNIAQIYDVGENYLVMEYVDGEPVRAPDNIRKLLDIAVQIADGLAAAHAAGFVHRDLKPDNVLGTTDGRAKILDFGLAKLAVAGGTMEATRTIAVTNPGTILGTAAYMSPEQARAEELDARSDQFSFGLILYELAAGKRAFQRASAPETLTAIIREDPEPLSATVPSPLRCSIERLLAKDPDERYASTKDLFAELRAMRTRISEISSVAVSVPPAKTKPTRLVLVAGAVVLAAATLVIAVAVRSANPAVSRYRFTPFAVTAASESQPVWSPDGRTIAYYETLNGITRIVLKAVGRNAPPIPLVQVPALGTLSWSPDGERIYYNARSAETVNVFFVSRAGGQPTRLIRSDPFLKDGTLYEAPAISPDGKIIALLAARSQVRIPLAAWPFRRLPERLRSRRERRCRAASCLRPWHGRPMGRVSWCESTNRTDPVCGW